MASRADNVASNLSLANFTKATELKKRLWFTLGALVLFRMIPRAIAKHVGILTGTDSFLHAHERLGVIEEPLTPAWRRRIAFAFLFPRD